MKIAIHQKMKLPMAFKTNPPMKAILPKKIFSNPTAINNTSSVTNRPPSRVNIPKINSIIILSFFVQI